VGTKLTLTVGAVRLHAARGGLQPIAGNGLAAAQIRQISSEYGHVPRFWGIFGWVPGKRRPPSGPPRSTAAPRWHPPDRRPLNKTGTPPQSSSKQNTTISLPILLPQYSKYTELPTLVFTAPHPWQTKSQRRPILRRRQAPLPPDRCLASTNSPA
jgi:hypothetical protein